MKKILLSMVLSLFVYNSYADFLLSRETNGQEYKPENIFPDIKDGKNIQDILNYQISEIQSLKSEIREDYYNNLLTKKGYSYTIEKLDTKLNKLINEKQKNYEAVLRKTRISKKPEEESDLMQSDTYGVKIKPNEQPAFEKDFFSSLNQYFNGHIFKKDITIVASTNKANRYRFSCDDKKNSFNAYTINYYEGHDKSKIKTALMLMFNKTKSLAKEIDFSCDTLLEKGRMESEVGFPVNIIIDFNGIKSKGMEFLIEGVEKKHLLTPLHETSPL